MSTQAFALLDWLVDTWTAAPWPAGTIVKVIDGPMTTDVSGEILLFVGSEAALIPIDDSAVSHSQWHLLGNPTGNRRDETITVKGSLWDRRGGSNIRVRRAEANQLWSVLESAVRDGGMLVGPAGSPPDARVVWVELTEVTVRQMQTTEGATVELPFILTAFAKS